MGGGNGVGGGVRVEKIPYPGTNFLHALVRGESYGVPYQDDRVATMLSGVHEPADDEDAWVPGGTLRRVQSEITTLCTFTLAYILHQRKGPCQSSLLRLAHS